MMTPLHRHRVGRHPRPDDDGKQYERRTDLDNTQNQHDEGQHTGSRDVENGKDYAGKQRLQEGDADDATRYVANRSTRKSHKPDAPISRDAVGKCSDADCKPRRRSEQEPGDDNRRNEAHESQTAVATLPRTNPPVSNTTGSNRWNSSVKLLDARLHVA